MHVYTHIRPRTLPPASNNREDADNTPISPSVKNNPPCQATSLFHELVHPLYCVTHSRPPKRIYCSDALGSTTALSRKSSKSMLAHDAVAAVLSHKHHPIIHVGAGPIQLVYALHSRLNVQLVVDKILCSPLIWRNRVQWVCYRVFPAHRNRFFDPASEFLSTHWWSQNPACQRCFSEPLKNCHTACKFLQLP